MLRGLFVTGTDTNVGKTVVAAALLHRYRGGTALSYWKPIQTGSEQDDDTALVQTLGSCTESEVFDSGVRLPLPLSPHLAARCAGRKIEIERLARLLPANAEQTRWVVEGAGGLLVPINETQMMADLIERLALPVLLVARTALGTINHTLLTLECLRRRSLCLAGVVLVGEPNQDNSAAIRQFGRVPVLGEMPRFASLSAEGLRRWATMALDPSGLLRGYLND